MPVNPLPIMLATRPAIRRAIANPGRDGLEALFSMLGHDTPRIFDHFVGKALRTADTWTAGGAGSAGVAIGTQTPGGRVAMATGAVNNQAAILYSPGRVFSPNQNACIAARFQIDTASLFKVELGFSDSEAAGILGATGVGVVNACQAAPTLNAGPSDAVCAILDTSQSGTINGSTGVRWHLVSAKAGTTQIASSNNAAPAGIKDLAAATDLTVGVILGRMELGATDDTAAFLFINDKIVAQISSAAITTLANLTPYLMVQARSAASRTLSCDWIDIRADAGATVFA